MKHNLKISVSKKPQVGGLVTYRNLSVRERILRFLLGSKQRVTIVIPGDSIEELSICEMTKGGTDLEQNKVTDPSPIKWTQFSRTCIVSRRNATKVISYLRIISLGFGLS